MIPIYIGISHRFDMVKGMTERSILANTNAEVEITHLYPEKESGCTGFSDVRFQIDYGIYLDSDMIVLGDIAELWSYRKKDKYVCMKDGSTEVAVIDFRRRPSRCRRKSQINALPRSCDIPLEWNVEDYNYFPNSPLPDNMKLFHFTSLPHQPWLYKHPNQYALELYEQWKTPTTLTKIPKKKKRKKKAINESRYSD
jgi:hypothetical protein